MEIVKYLKTVLYKLLQVLRWTYLFLFRKKILFNSLNTDSLFSIEDSQISLIFDIKNAYKIIIENQIEIPFYKNQVNSIVNKKLDSIQVTAYGVNSNVTKQVHLKSHIYTGQNINAVKWNQQIFPKFKIKFNLTSSFSTEKKIFISTPVFKNKNISIKQYDLAFSNIIPTENELTIIINNKTNQL